MSEFPQRVHGPKSFVFIILKRVGPGEVRDRSKFSQLTKYCQNFAARKAVRPRVQRVEDLEQMFRFDAR